MNIAIVGATGNVGRKILEVLEKKELSIDNLYFTNRVTAQSLRLFDFFKSIIR